MLSMAYRFNVIFLEKKRVFYQKTVEIVKSCYKWASALLSTEIVESYFNISFVDNIVINFFQVKRGLFFFIFINKELRHNAHCFYSIL